MGKKSSKNKKLVSIIIPFYKQSESDLAVPLSSINNQIGIDFSKLDVHLVNDGGAPIDATKFDVFANLDLHYHEYQENGGPGVARQYGIDHSESDYLMFIDADDVLNGIGTLLDFFDTIKNTGNHQIISTNYLEQSPRNAHEFVYHIHGNQDSAGVYAKWFNRQYLKQIHLRFAPDLRIFEDVYFVHSAICLASDIVHLDKISYMWRYRSSSLMREDEGLAVRKNLHQHVIQERHKCEFIQKNRPKMLRDVFEVALVEIFLVHKKFPPIDEKAFSEEFQKFMTAFKHVWEGYTPRLQLIATRSSLLRFSYYEGLDTSDLQNFIKDFPKN